MSTAANGIAFPVAAAIALAASAALVSRLERLAGRWHLSEAMLGLVVALAADSPEISSAITASVHGQHDIGSGVVLGSNVFNLAALLGLGALVARRIPLHRSVVLLEGTTAVWVALVALIVVASVVPPAAGLALVTLVVVPYVLVSASPPGGGGRIRLASRFVGFLRRAVAEEEIEIAPAIHAVPAGRADGLVAAVCVAVVVASSSVMERSAEALGKTWHLSPLLVGGIVLAAVTSLPNAVGAVYLARRGRGSAVLSEAMNSNMLNVLVGLLLPGIFVGVGTGGGSVLIAAWCGGLTVVSLAIAYAARGLPWRWGIVIVAGYAAFIPAVATR